MQPFMGYEAARKKANYSASAQLPVGGYVAKIIEVRYEPVQSGNSDMINIAFDIEEGEHKGFFRKQYEENTNEDKKWKGRTTIYVPTEDGSERDGWTKNAFARWTAALENSNNGYTWDWDESKWKGKLIGLIFGEIGTVIDGREIVYVGCRFPESVEKIRKGEFKIPNIQKKKGFTGTKTASTSETEDFMKIPDNIEDEVPFL